ncbi:MAG TPA: nucleotidyltransferase domain-containing protein [Burkholderiales bacterium]|nr:nucleotidyltransferase domain-containing protein [Burkholderiales bacterium]
MRLTETQRSLIKSAVARIIGPDSKVWLFGSRVDDSKRGGDIDLLVETEQLIPSRASALCRLEGALVMSLGDRKIDVLLKDGRGSDAPIFQVAKDKGVLL